MPNGSQETPFSPISLSVRFPRRTGGEDEAENRGEKRRERSATSPFGGSLSAPLQDASVPVGTSVQRSVAILGAVAAGARHALRSPDGSLGRVQQPIQHLADGAVLAIERVGVHVRLRSRQSTFEHDLAPVRWNDSPRFHPRRR